jgi:hypothetical protein
VLSGSLPPGLSPGTYTEQVQLAARDPGLAIGGRSKLMMPTFPMAAGQPQDFRGIEGPGHLGPGRQPDLAACPPQARCEEPGGRGVQVVTEIVGEHDRAGNVRSRHRLGYSEHPS